MNIAKYFPLLLVAAAFGCGSGKPSTTAVTGTVTYDGQAVEDAVVNFGSSEGKQSASGRTDAEGKFRLTTFEQGDGAIPGNYTVTVSKVAMEGGMTSEAEHAAIEAGKPVESAQEVNQLPARYRNGETSGLTAEVTEGGKNHFEFELSD